MGGSTEIDLEVTEILKLADKEFKITIMFNDFFKRWTKGVNISKISVNKWKLFKNNNWKFKSWNI